MNRKLLLLTIFFAGLITLNGQQAKFKIRKETGKSSEAYQSMTFDGAWCWFSDPRAVYFEGKYKRTYTGWIDSYGNIYISYFDHVTQKSDSKIIYANLEIDDHDNPSILLDETGRLMVFFSKHTSQQPIFLLRSVNPEDITQWNKPQELALNDAASYPGLRDSYTYCNPVKLSAEKGRIYLFWRGLDGKPAYSTSDDNGQTWTKGKIFIMPDQVYNFRRPYVKIYSNGKDKIHIAFTDGHPRDESENSIYYMYMQNGSFFKANGTRIKSEDQLPVKPREADVVYDATQTKQKAWIWDVAESEKGNPVVAYAKFPSDTTHIYVYANWDLQKWQNTDLVNSGKWFPKTYKGKTEPEPNYSGGISIDHENVNTLYLSVKRDSVFEIEKWTTQNGKAWNVEYVTKGSSKDNVRPFAVRGAKEGNPLQLFWMQNTRYHHYGLGTETYKVSFEERYLTSIKASVANPSITNPKDSAQIIALMKMSADWQLANPSRVHRLDWHWGAFYIGLMELYRSSGDTRYLNEMMNVGKAYNWKLRDDILHADRIAIADVFASLYELQQDPVIIDKARWAMDIHIARGTSKTDVKFKDNPYRFEWWTWCDALFMAPPSFARMYKLTGEKKYLDYMSTQWWKTSDYLYSPVDSMYFRDDNFLDKKSTHGKKIFWSRGNGWVVAGLARIMNILPKDYPARVKFEEQYKQMAHKLLSLQQPDGLWTVSLFDPEELPTGESSGSAFFCYALAWGLNNGLLDKKYQPQVEKAWVSLTKNVNNWGRLGNVQQVAGSPYPFYEHQWHVYATGAFLLAGTEMIRLLK